MSTGKVFLHDPNGNLTDDGTTKYTYDVENRLTNLVGEHNGRLYYDPMGRLYKTNSYNTSENSTETTYFLYSGDNVIAEYQSGQMTKRYVHGGGRLAPLVEFNGSSIAGSARRFLHTNHQGSVVAATNDNGDVVALNTYDAYGVAGAGNEGRFSYTGQIQLPEFGLYHYRARMYNAEIGRFLQTDPIGYEDQMNLYAYVYNDPMNATDPSGMAGELQYEVDFYAKIMGFKDAEDANTRGPIMLRNAIERDLVRTRQQALPMIAFGAGLHPTSRAALMIAVAAGIGDMVDTGSSATLTGAIVPNAADNYLKKLPGVGLLGRYITAQIAGYFASVSMKKFEDNQTENSSDGQKKLGSRLEPNGSFSGERSGLIPRSGAPVIDCSGAGNSNGCSF